MGGYAYLSFASLQDSLLERLQDSAGAWTSVAEAQVYLTEALRVLNAQTSAGTSGQWSVDYQFDFNPGDGWKTLNVPGSPRQRTVTDTFLLTQMQYMLLEPPTGKTWTGTTQFDSENLIDALQYRRDELLQNTGANVVQFITNSPTNSQRTTLPDTTLDLRRVRWIPVIGPENPYALSREDVVTVDGFGAQLPIQTNPPDSWMITANAPLAFDVSSPPNVPGQWDLLVLQSGINLDSSASTVMGLPDDWTHVAMYGALADCLSNAPEARDDIRAKYCLMRYERGMKAMMKLPWLLDANVYKVPVDTPFYKQMDAYGQNWENTWPIGDPQIVVGGMDYIALAPFNLPAPNTTVVSSVLTVVGNAPVDPTQPVQLARDAIDAVLAYAQHLAMFKCGGKDFLDTMPLLKQFEDYCALQNKRYAALGIMRAEMFEEGDKSEDVDPRFGPPQKEAHGKQAT